MREQLVTQIKLGIVSEDLAFGEKLPSRQEIARRFKIHPNTISNAYKELTDKGLVEFRQGSGFYVTRTYSGSKDVDLSALATKFINAAKSFGFSELEIKKSIDTKLNYKAYKSFLVIESDTKLREILIEEIKSATGAIVYGISIDDFENEYQDINANFVVSFNEKPRVDEILANKKPYIYLKPTSVSASMQGESRPSKDSLTAIVSGWDRFLAMAKTFLVAAQIEADSIITKNTNDENWSRGLDGTWAIICDAFSAKSIPDEVKDKVRVFRVISGDSIDELKDKYSSVAQD